MTTFKNDLYSDEGRSAELDFQVYAPFPTSLPIILPIVQRKEFPSSFNYTFNYFHPSVRGLDKMRNILRCNSIPKGNPQAIEVPYRTKFRRTKFSAPTRNFGIFVHQKIFTSTLFPHTPHKKNVLTLVCYHFDVF